MGAIIGFPVVFVIRPFLAHFGTIGASAAPTQQGATKGV
jgi:hypothetical protein